MISFKKIGNFSIIYAILKAYSRLMVFLFHRKVEKRFREPLPENCPLIFAPNHQNALIDAMLVHYFVDGRMIFLARSDIFHKDLVANILKTFAVMPVFRIRDGYSSLQNNDEIFDISIELLRAKQKMAILPEGNHAAFRFLRPLKKGVARISLQAEADGNFELGLKVIPVGINYSHYNSRNAIAFLSFGKAIEVKKYATLYSENPQKAYNALTRDLAEGIKAEIEHIPSEEHYQTYEKAIEIGSFSKGKCCENLAKKLETSQTIIKKLEQTQQNEPEKFITIANKIKEYTILLNQIGTKTRLFELNIDNSFLFSIKALVGVLGFPLFATCWLLNWLPQYFPLKMAKKIKDEAFHSSVIFVMSLVSFLIFYILLYIAISIILNNWILPLLILIVLPISIIYSFRYHRFAVKILAIAKYLFAGKDLKLKYQEAKEMRNQIISLIS